MNDTQNKWRATINAVLAFFAANPAILAIMNALQTLVDRLISLATNIDQTNNQLVSLAVGNTEEKNAKKKVLVKNIYTLAGQLDAYARTNGNVVLAEQSSNILKTCRKVREFQLLSIASSLIDLLNGALEDLADYNINAAKIAALTAQRNDFQTALDQKAVAVQTKIALNKDLRALFKEANLLMKTEMDRLMKPFENSHPQQYAEYLAARGIIDTGNRHNNVEPPPEPTA